uniref:Uncharacterized protein n=1 Tax=Ditylenchus dipsaci TaxID=166011 RepID=A0A915CPE4_9BILA
MGMVDEGSPAVSPEKNNFGSEMSYESVEMDANRTKSVSRPLKKVIDHIVDLQHELNNPISFSARSAGEQMPTAMESVQQLILQLSTLVQFKRN